MAFSFVIFRGYFLNLLTDFNERGHTKCTLNSCKGGGDCRLFGLAELSRDGCGSEAPTYEQTDMRRPKPVHYQTWKLVVVQMTKGNYEGVHRMSSVFKFCIVERLTSSTGGREIPSQK